MSTAKEAERRRNSSLHRKRQSGTGIYAALLNVRWFILWLSVNLMGVLKDLAGPALSLQVDYIPLKFVEVYVR